jgi:hypothetical protein
MRLSEEYQDRTGFGDRNTEIATHLRRIEELVEYFDCPFLMTMQAYGNPQAYGGARSWGGSLLKHTMTYHIKIKPAQGSFRKALLRGHSSQPDNEVLLTIGGDRLTAHKEDP